MIAERKHPPSRCRSCGARIVWATMERSGKHSPFVLDPDGEWIINHEGVASHQGKAPEFVPPEQCVARYKSHFADCPQSGSWRKK